MTDDFMLRTAARSNTGLVRKNNQDSGYAGPNFLLIADGMGGHAGGDVASAITVSQLEHMDSPDHGPAALDDLREDILTANERITNSVGAQPELAGMGTTVTALLRSDQQLALAHIGDSRAYLLRGGILTQITSDHTFVQMLVDEGRITPEEAENHPQRSVVMRVLGDVGAAPELDLSIREARPGDRWMLCSDGLTGFADIDEIASKLEGIQDPGACADALIDLALAGGGGDNVTVVIGDVVPATDRGLHASGVAVGSVAINPQYSQLGMVGTDTGEFTAAPGNEDDTEVLPTSGESAAVDTPAFLTDQQGEPPATYASAAEAAEAADGDVAESGSEQDADAAERAEASQVPTQPMAIGSEDDEDGVSSWALRGDEPAATRENPTRAAESSADTASAAKGEGSGAAASATSTATAEKTVADDEKPRRKHRKGLMATIVTLIVIVVVAAAGVLGWRYIQSQYYVTAVDGRVAVYSGVSQDLGPFSLSKLSETTDVQVADLSDYSRDRLDETIPATSRQQADSVVSGLREEAQQNSTGSSGIKGSASDDASDDPAPSKTPGGN